MSTVDTTRSSLVDTTTACAAAGDFCGSFKGSGPATQLCCGTLICKNNICSSSPPTVISTSTTALEATTVPVRESTTSTTHLVHPWWTRPFPPPTITPLCGLKDAACGIKGCCDPQLTCADAKCQWTGNNSFEYELVFAGVGGSDGLPRRFSSAKSQISRLFLAVQTNLLDCQARCDKHQLCRGIYLWQVTDEDASDSHHQDIYRCVGLAALGQATGTQTRARSVSYARKQIPIGERVGDIDGLLVTSSSSSPPPETTSVTTTMTSTATTYVLTSPCLRLALIFTLTLC